MVTKLIYVIGVRPTKEGLDLPHLVSIAQVASVFLPLARQEEIISLRCPCAYVAIFS